ncbi:H-2 class I histocompatibility antigen, Q9 alpha chain-like [Poecilia latipinna]|uniref:H-2 class I histocompatibility antigen, Q9 alpha chain-like n=1 Tax=Poecilia latipinna TaxID=48699 RepID=UPI00072DCFFA|nr:PREDICTED: H-2 class I histocompatibility antigen, Q9 alpha chain-like [Poecilia latipinna]
MGAVRILILLILLELKETEPVIHSLRYFYSASSGLPDVPSYMSAGFLDDVQISYCDSRNNRNIPKQDWMNNVSSDNSHYWEEETLTCLAKQETLKENIEIAKLRLNQTGGVHVYQHIYGCDWDNETGQVKGFAQIGYDGEDFIALDLNTSLWIAAKPEAVLTKHKWDKNKYALQYEKFYFLKVCVEWLKKYERSGRRSLMKTVLPSVSLLQKTSSSPVSCLATGFYPNKAEIFSRKGEKQIHKGVETGEILPNNDGTFQMSVHIDLSSVGPEDWSKYECVFQLSGVNSIIHRLEKTRILTNESNTSIVIIAVVAALAVLGLIAVIGFIVYKKKNAKRPPSPVAYCQPPEETQFLPHA